MSTSQPTDDHVIDRESILDRALLKHPGFLRFERNLEADLERMVDRWASSAAPNATRRPKPKPR